MFEVEIKEVLSTKISIKANNEEEAIKIAEELYYCKKEIVLDASDHKSTEFIIPGYKSILND